MRAGDAAAPFVELAYRDETPESRTPLIPGAAHAADGVMCLGPPPGSLDKAAPLKRSDATSRKRSPTPSQAYRGGFCAVSVYRADGLGLLTPAVPLPRQAGSKRQ
jgi:hypothetical protein